MYTRIVTHNDLDGLVSAALCAAVHGIDLIVFAGPNHISRTGFSVNTEDVVCDLPWPGECGLWFDHHDGNRAELVRLGHDVSKFPGAFSPEKSCARVVYNHYKDEYDFPDFYADTVAETDKIDSFDYKDVADWRKETPARIINDSLKGRFKSHADEDAYLLSLIPRLAERSMADIASDTDVLANYRDYLNEEERMLDIIRQHTRFHPLDKSREFAILDLTSFNRRPVIVRNLAQIIYPDIKVVFLLQNLFQDNVKTNSFSISGSLTIKNGNGTKDIGEIMRVLNIGDGHSGAGSGQIQCLTKNEMEDRKNEVVDRVFKIWISQ